MISIGKYRIVHESEMRKFQKLHKIFRAYDERELDDIINGKVHLHRNPRRKEGNGNGRTTMA